MILICSDSFKDAASALRVCTAIKRGLVKGGVNLPIDIFPMSDGGDGLNDILQYHMHCDQTEVRTLDPLRRPISTHVLHLPTRRSVYFAMAQSAGIELLPQNERNPLKTSTHGVGMILEACASMDIEHVYVGLGGSATHDIGTGMAQHLGWKFKSADSTMLEMNGRSLELVEGIEPPDTDILSGIDIHFLTDVDNPLLGPSGAALTFGKQKGASSEMLLQLDSGTDHICNLVKSLFDIDIATFPGGGAAGGMGAGGMIFLNAHLTRGMDAISDLTGLDSKIAQASLVITGEGSLDHQTLNGKLVDGVVSRAQKSGIPIVVFCGQCKLSPEAWRTAGIDMVVEVSKGEPDLMSAIQNTEPLLEKWSSQFATDIESMAGG